MKNNIEIRDLILITTIFILNPFVGFLVSVYKVISSKNNRKYLIYIMIFYGFFGLIFLSGPEYDIRAHYLTFKFISKQKNMEFWKFLLEQKDILIFIYYRILSYWTSNPRWIGFFSAMISYGIPYYLIADFSQKNKLNKYETLIFILLFLGITPSYKFSGMRNFNAICLFSLGVYMVDILKNRKGYIYIFLAPLLHASILTLTLVYFLSKYVKVNKLKVIISLIFSISFINFSKIILLKSLIIFPDYSKFIKSYIEGKHATAVAASRSIILIVYIFYFLVYTLFYFKILHKSKLKGLRFFKFLICYFPIVSLFSFSDSMYVRYLGNIVLLLIVTIIYIYTVYFQRNKILLLIILGFSLLSYSIMVRIEIINWNPKIISSSVFGFLKEGEKLNTKEHIMLRR